MKMFHTYLMIKVSLLFYDDSRFDDIKNEFHLLSLNYIYIRDWKIFDFLLSEWCMNFNISIILIVLFISSDSFHLVILFTNYFIYFTFYVSLLDNKISNIFTLDFVHCLEILYKKTLSTEVNLRNYNTIFWI